MKLDETSVRAHLKYVFGIEVKDDTMLIRHIIGRTEDLIHNFCHRSDIPDGAVHPAIEYVCGHYLLNKINTGTLTDDDGNPLYEFARPESSVKMGDVSINFESGYGSLEGDNGLLALANEMADEKRLKLELAHFRKVKWR